MLCDIERDEEQVRTGVGQVVDHDGILRERRTIISPDEVDQVLIGQLHLHPLACSRPKGIEKVTVAAVRQKADNKLRW